MEANERKARIGYRVRIMQATQKRRSQRVENITAEIAEKMELTINDPRVATIRKLVLKNKHKIINAALKTALERESRRAIFKTFVYEVSALREQEKFKASPAGAR